MQILALTKWKSHKVGCSFLKMGRISIWKCSLCSYSTYYYSRYQSWW